MSPTPTAPDAPALRLGTRGSALAVAQARIVADALAATGTDVELVPIVTDGDRRAPDTPWGEGVFVTALEAALRDGSIDLAVHSAKDLPTDEDPGLVIAAFLSRADTRDALVLPEGRAIGDVAGLAPGSRIGTDSPRRTAFLRAARSDLDFRPLHGNVDTRLRRLDGGEADALVLACAGLERLGLAERIGLRLPPETVPPAPGQGALAVQVRALDEPARTAVAPLDDRPTRLAVEAERMLLALSGGGCRAPLGAQARLHGTELSLLGGYARIDGTIVAVARDRGPAGAHPLPLATRVLGRLAARATIEAQTAGQPGLIVTRPRDQAAATALALVDRGFAPLPVPAIEIEAAPSPELVEALGDLGTIDAVVVTSANAVPGLLAAAHEAGVTLPPEGAGPRWIAIGRATARALSAAGLPVETGPGRPTATDLAATLDLPPGARVVAPRGDLALDTLATGLAERGIRVEAPVAYRTIEAPPDSAVLLAAALGRDPVGAVVTSGSTVRGLLALGESIGVAARVRRLPVVAIGPTTAAEARRLGFGVVAEAASPAPAEIADAAAAAFPPPTASIDGADGGDGAAGIDGSLGAAGIDAVSLPEPAGDRT